MTALKELLAILLVFGPLGVGLAYVVTLIFD